jgi:DNA-nicking Smr family endonuclease
MSSRKQRNRSLSAEERALWDHVTRTVRRTMSDMPDSLETDGLEPSQDAPKQASPKATTMRPRRQLDTPPPPPQTKDLRPGATHEMDGRTARRFKRGKLPIDARLDLHGHTQQMAHRALNRFIEDAFHVGYRTVLVVTGKGGRDGEPGILWRMVPIWLNETPLRQWISGFSHASPRDGGTGALYIRVKRRRDT